MLLPSVIETTVAPERDPRVFAWIWRPTMSGHAQIKVCVQILRALCKALFAGLRLGASDSPPMRSPDPLITYA